MGRDAVIAWVEIRDPTLVMRDLTRVIGDLTTVVQATTVAGSRIPRLGSTFTCLVQIDVRHKIADHKFVHA